MQRWMTDPNDYFSTRLEANSYDQDPRLDYPNLLTALRLSLHHNLGSGTLVAMPIKVLNTLWEQCVNQIICVK